MEGSASIVRSIWPLSGFFVEPILPGVLGVLGPLLGITVSLLLILFLYYSNRNQPIPSIGKRGKVFFSIGFLCLLVFVCSWLVWVVNVDDDWYITGLTLTSEAEKAIQQKMTANETPKTLLDRMGHDSPERIWSGRWVVTAVLAFSFAGIFRLTGRGRAGGRVGPRLHLDLTP